MKKNTTPTLHDAVFKQFLTHPETAECRRGGPAQADVKMISLPVPLVTPT